MIKVQRTQEPNVLRRNSARWLTVLQSAYNELAQIENDPQSTEQQKKQAQAKVKKAQSKYNHPMVKNTLERMFYGKCAYCESKITVVTYGQIEHFYPKGDTQYRHKTFEWNNLLLSCDICNNAQHKGTRFPLDVNGNPVLIDPSDGLTDPNIHLLFSWDGHAKIASIYGRDARGPEIEHVFDLNGVRGRKELIRERSNHVKKLIVLLRFAEAGNAEAEQILKDACQPDAPYSAFALTHIAPFIP